MKPTSALRKTLSTGLALLCLCSLAAPAAADPDLRIPFLTVRNSTGADDPRVAFGDQRSDLSAGWCGVRELDFSMFSNIAESVPSYIREEFFRLESVLETGPDEVFGALDGTLPGRGPVLFTHGFYIDFEKGCRRAIMLQRNAGLAGRLLWFSWPSDGALMNYARDEADLYWSVPDMADSLIAMADRFGDGRVHVAGHSLGGRGIVLALYEVANRNPDTRLGDVVLLAPDMDFEIFQRILPRIRPIVDRITVYVTSGDRPLALSAQLHGYARLGESGNDVSTLDGVEVIDLSSLPALSPSGHVYHIESEEVGADLSQLLNEGKPASERRNLIQVGSNLWRLQPSNWGRE